jgi:Prokaryotic N-terminal methylation motif
MTAHTPRPPPPFAVRHCATRRRPRRRAKTLGLSLVEVVIALAIFSMISGLFYGALWMGQQQLLRLQRTDRAHDQGLQARRFFQSAVESLTVIGLPAVGRAPMVDGRTDSLTFHGMAPGAYGGAQPLVYRFTITQVQGPTSVQSSLRLTRQALSAADEDAVGVQTAELLTHQGALSFRFAGYKPGSGELVWDETWTDLLRVPAHIAVVDETEILFMATPRIGRDMRCILKRGELGLAGTDCGLK